LAHEGDASQSSKVSVGWPLESRGSASIAAFETDYQFNIRAHIKSALGLYEQGFLRASDCLIKWEQVQIVLTLLVDVAFAGLTPTSQHIENKHPN
jgi:hypothetical protein